MSHCLVNFLSLSAFAIRLRNQLIKFPNKRIAIDMKSALFQNPNYPLVEGRPAFKIEDTAFVFHSDDISSFSFWHN